MIRLCTVSAIALAAGISVSAAGAATLNVVCSNEQVWCDLMAQNFKIDTGIDVAMVRKSTGEVLAQIRAEAGNPKIDVWWGGTGDPHMIAAAEDLTEASGVDTSQLLGWARNMADMTDGKAIGVFAINYDITLMLAMEDMLRQFTATEMPNMEPERISRNVSDLLDELIDQSVAIVGKPVALMTKEDKVRAIHFLNDTGAFLITKSGDKVCKFFGISKYTLYSYIDEAKN